MLLPKNHGLKKILNDILEALKKEIENHENPLTKALEQYDKLMPDPSTFNMELQRWFIFCKDLIDKEMTLQDVLLLFDEPRKVSVQKK